MLYKIRVTTPAENPHRPRRSHHVPVFFVDATSEEDAAKQAFEVVDPWNTENVIVREVQQAIPSADVLFATARVARYLEKQATGSNVDHEQLHTIYAGGEPAILLRSDLQVLIDFVDKASS